ncbi:extracellular solute-binding protein, partial [Patescibacteria group bacterium]|nr:extracellular solute-binding protein [Patescibacteria group bacterium]
DRDGTEDIYNPIIADFQSQHPDITISYVKKNPDTYENDLLNALASGNGPDVFILRDAEFLKHANKLAPAPQQALNYAPADFHSDFVDGVSDLVSSDGNIWGVPSFMDTLALLYNRDIFNSANVPEAPKTWEDFLSAAGKMTQTSELGSITVAGAAMGGANVSGAEDILSALMMQSGATIVDPSSKTVDIAESKRIDDASINPGNSALAFFVSFANPRSPYYSWSPILPESRDYFSQGKVGMMLGFASDVQYIQAKNPHLNLSVSFLPQPKNAPARINYGRYHFFAVSRISPNVTAAWQFALAASHSAGEQGLNIVSLTPPALRNLANAKPPAAWLAPFYQQSLSARTWLIPDADATQIVFLNMINAVLNGKTDVPGAVNEAGSKLQNLVNNITGTK